jgi:hypothetical protein
MSKKYLYLSISLLIFMALFISACAATRTPVPAVQEE